MKNIKISILLLIFTIVLIGCNSGNKVSSSSSSGIAQKGPFLDGSTVTAYKLNNGERSTTDKKSTTTNDDKGSFLLPLPWSGATEYEIKGEYLDENTGNYVSNGILSAIVNLQANSSPNININIFTHIAAAQIKDMLKNGENINVAKENAREKIKEMFSLELSNDTQLEDLDLTDGISSNKSDNAQLLKISAAILASDNPDTSLDKLTKLITVEGDINTDVINTYNDILEKADNVDLFSVSNILSSTIGVSNAPSENTRQGSLPFNHNLSFDTKVDQDINKGLISNYIVINKLSSTAKLTINNGYYSLNDGEFTDIETTVKNGDSIRVKHYSLDSFSSENISTLNIGVSRITFKSITKANPTLNITSPNKFSFPIRINAPLGGLITSDEIIVSGLSNGVVSKVGITSGASYKINDGTWKSNQYEDTLQFASVRNGDIVKVSKAASSSYGGKEEATLTIGGIEGKFIIFSKEKDLKPDLFFPKTVYLAELNTKYETSYFKMSGYEGGLDIKVTNGEVQLEGEKIWLSELSQVPTGYKVKFRQTSSSSYGTIKNTHIEVGKSIVNFETKTIDNPSVPSSNVDKIEFKTVFDADFNSFVESEERIISGINDTATYAYVSNGAQMSVNGSAWTSEAMDIGAGSKIKLRIKTALDNNSTNAGYLYYGPEKKLFASFHVYNKKIDTKIDSIDFIDKENAAINTYYESNIVTIKGIDSYTNVKIVNAEFKINGGEWKTSSDKLLLYVDNTLQLRHKSSQEANDIVRSIVSFDNAQYEFKTKTSNAPVLLNEIPTRVNQNSNYTFIPNVSDFHTLTYSLISKPTWMSINTQTGEINGTAGQNDIGQSDTISLLIKSSSGLETNIDFKVMVDDVNDAPILSDIWTSSTTDENRNYSKQARAIDIEGGDLTWSISNNPTWLNINTQTGELTGIPRQTDVGIKKDIKVIVSEEGGLSSSFTFNLTVIDKNSNVTLSAISDKTVNENEELTVQIHANDLDGDILIFNIQNQPSWLTFDKEAQTLSGTPTKDDIGDINITISVTDGKGSTRFESFKITVIDVNEVPIITSADFKKEFILDDTSATPNNYTFTFDISDNDNTLNSSNVTYAGVITETRVGFAKTANFSNTTLECLRGKCTAIISFAFQDIDDFHPSLKTRHTFTVSDGDKSVSNYIDIWYAPTTPILSGELSHTIEPKDKTSYEAFSFTPTNSGNKARTWEIKNMPNGFEFNKSTGELKYSRLIKGLLSDDTTFKGIEITATNDRGTSEKFIFNILVKGKPATPKFQFNDKVGVEIQQWFDSSVTVDWLETGLSKAVISSGYLGQNVHFGFKVNGQDGISGTTTVQNGDILTVWHKSSNEYDTTLDTTITIGNDSDTFSTTTKENENTKLPLIVGAPNTRANVGEVYSYIPQLSTDYTKFAAVTKPFTIENKPSWATFNTVTGALNGTPREINVYNQVRITAFGDNGLDDITFNITVSNDAPYINGAGHSLENPDLSFNFTDNATWRDSITEVSMFGCYDESTSVILNPSDYTFSEGSLKLHASTTTNPILRTPYIGGAGLVVKASNYPNSEVIINMVEDGQYAVKATSIEFADNKPITEANLNEARINIHLSNHLKFIDNSLSKNNFSLYSSPNGVSISNVAYINESIAQVTLQFDGTDFDEDKLIQISIAANELNICQEVITNSLDVTAVVEIPWSNVIYPSDPIDNAHFGNSVDVKDGTAAVIARSGIYIYNKDINGDYQETQKIAAFEGTEILGASIALDGDYLVAGNGNYYVEGNGLEGRVELYKKNENGIYSLIQNITVSGLSDSAHFGASVDISGDLLLIGAYNDDNHKGAAYLFKNNGSDNFALVETIKRADGKSSDSFGFDVAIDGDYFVIGSSVFPDLGATPIDTKPELGAGFANYYTYLNDTLELISVITPSDSSRLADHFGFGVAISGDHIAISSFGNNDTGSVYLYKRAFNTVISNGKIENTQAITGSVGIYHDALNYIVAGNNSYTPQGNDYIKSTVPSVYGYDVAIDQNEVIFGNWKNDDKAIDGGAVLITNIGETISEEVNDTIPHQFTFTDKTDASLDEVVSSSITITGINQEAPVSIINGEYSLDDGITWQTEALTLENNQLVKVRHQSSSFYATSVDTILTVGTISDTFSSRTITEPLKTVPTIIGKVGYSLENDAFIFSFEEDEAWESAISQVYYKAGVNSEYSLLKTYEYEITSGQIKLIINSSTTVDLRTPYSVNDTNGSIKIIADGYEDNTHSIASVTSGKNAIKIENSPHQDNTIITEANLDAAKIYVILGNSLEFKDNILDVNNFTLNLAPIGTTISSVTYNDSSSAIVTLAYDGSDFDTNAEVNVVVNKNELNTNVTVSGKYPITVTAIDEQNGGSTRGQAIDPYIVNARFWYDADGDSQEDEDEISSYSNENGEFIFNIQVPENALITMLDKGLHNGKVFDGNLSAKYSSSKQGLISPITSISTLGFTNQEIISLLVTNGFDANLSVEELYLDPFDSSILLEDMSIATDEQKAKLRRVLLSNVIINSAIMANSSGYDITKSNLEDFFNTVYSASEEGDFEGAPQDTTILKFLISLGNEVLSNDKLGSQSKIRARIFVTVSEYVSKRLKDSISGGGNPIWEFGSILSESQNMIYPLSYAYTKSLFNNMTNPKFAWVEIDFNYRPILMVNNQILGDFKKLTLIYKDSSNDEQTIEFIRDNQDFTENDVTSGQWMIQDRKVLANGKEYEILGDKIIVNGETFDIRDVIVQKEDDSLENYYEELPQFESSNLTNNETYVDLDTNIIFNYDKVLEAIHVNNTKCYIQKANEYNAVEVTPQQFSGASIIYKPSEDLLYNQKYSFTCSISYGEQSSYKSISFTTLPKPLPIVKTGQEDNFSLNNDISRSRNGNIVKDENTGLMWNDDGFNETRTNSSAKLYCSALTVDTYDDWRLPSAKEMQTLIIFDDTSPSNIDSFVNLIHFDYWTSTKSVESSTWNSDQYIKIKFPNEMGTEIEAGGNKFICVRDYEPSEEITVTELQWQDLSNDAKTWAEANTYCESLAGTWRLPSIQELLTTAGGKEVINDTYLNSLNSSFQGSLVDNYWSSTIYNSDNTRAYKMSARYGSISTSSKDTTNKVLCVGAL